jgi:hypothetical protein
VNNPKAAYGGVQRINAMAPQAPGPTYQGQVVAGQSGLNDMLSTQSQQTMRVPSTPVKGLLQRTASQAMSGQRSPAMAGRPKIPAGLGADIGYV